MFLARMISAQKWQSRTNITERQIPADGVTSDMRTTDNCLSFWMCDPTNPSSLEDVVLALASTRDKIERLDLLWLPEEQVNRIRIRIDQVEGETPAKTLNGRHRDLVGIDIWRLVGLGRSVSRAVKASQWQRFTKEQVSQILRKGIEQNIIAVDDLNEPLAHKIRQASQAPNPQPP